MQVVTIDCEFSLPCLMTKQSTTKQVEVGKTLPYPVTHAVYWHAFDILGHSPKNFTLGMLLYPVNLFIVH